MRPVNIKDLQDKSRDLGVRLFDPARPNDPYTAIVESRTSSTFNHVVTLRFNRKGDIHARCTCTWARYGGVACAHVLAALSKLAERKERTLSFWLSAEEAQRQKQRVLRLLSEEGAIYITSRREHSATAEAG
ncbi:MAG TPA: SWIM zinc finger domain-containing protein [Aggregatilineales bacterium]|nr:SWIM zinc finger family protein [Anaerolineales bacterium]HRE49731.1 SWIM zinc finger domain-containing protein [Aggregatilineales bacterium]